VKLWTPGVNAVLDVALNAPSDPSLANVHTPLTHVLPLMHAPAATIASCAASHVTNIGGVPEHVFAVH
jgi:hypothetical protein